MGRERVREEKDSEERRSEKIQVREKVEKSRNTVFFQCFSNFGNMGMSKKCTSLWREAHLDVKM